MKGTLSPKKGYLRRHILRHGHKQLPKCTDTAINTRVASGLRAGCEEPSSPLASLSSRRDSEKVRHCFHVETLSNILMVTLRFLKIYFAHSAGPCAFPKNWKSHLSLRSRLSKMPERSKSEAGRVHWMAEIGPGTLGGEDRGGKVKVKEG